MTLAPLTDEDRDGLTEEEIEAFEAKEETGTDEEDGDDTSTDKSDNPGDGDPDEPGDDKGGEGDGGGDDDEDAGGDDAKQDDTPGDETGEADTETVDKTDDDTGAAGDKEEEEPEGETQEITYSFQDPGVITVMSDDDIKKIETDAAEKIKGFNEEIKALKEKYGDGQMETTDYMDQYNDLRDKIRDANFEVKAKKDKNEDAISRRVEMVNTNWKNAQAAFFKQHKVFGDPGSLNSALVGKVNAFIDTPEGQAMSDIEVLQHCYDDIMADFKANGIVIPGENDGKKSVKKADKADKVKKAKQEAAKKTGTDLADVPVQMDLTTANWMDKLDALAEKDKEAWEEAIENLPNDKYNTYMKRGR